MQLIRKEKLLLLLGMHKGESEAELILVPFDFVRERIICLPPSRIVQTRLAGCNIQKVSSAVQVPIRGFRARPHERGAMLRCGEGLAQVSDAAQGLRAIGWRMGVSVPASPCARSATPQGARSVRTPQRPNKVPLKSWEKCQICHLLPFPLPVSWQPRVVPRCVQGGNKPREERCSKGCAKMPDSCRITTPAENKRRLTELVRYTCTYLAKSTEMELLILYI